MKVILKPKNSAETMAKKPPNTVKKPFNAHAQGTFCPLWALTFLMPKGKGMPRKKPMGKRAIEENTIL